MAIEQRTEVGFDPAGRPEEQVPVGETEAKRGQGHDHEQDHVGLKVSGSFVDGDVDGLAENHGDRYLHGQAG